MKRMRRSHSPLRRRLVLGACGAMAVASVHAETSKSIARVAVLIGGQDEGDRQEWRADFARHGYADGRSLKLTFEDWGGDTAVLEARARAIVASRPDLICSWHTTPSLLLSRLTRDIPIVFFSAVDPDRTGLVESLKIPGRNVTGVSNRFLETVGKRLELLKELHPGARAVALIIRRDSLWGTVIRGTMALGANHLGLVIRDVAVLAEPDTKDLVQALRQTRADAFLPSDVSFFPPHWVQIQTAAGMPGLFQNGKIVRAGGLLSIGPDLRDQRRRGVAIAARILRGERPSHFPVDQATRIESVLNLRTAEAFGWEVPPSVLLRVTEVVK